MGNYGNTPVQNNDFWSRRRKEVGYRLSDLCDKIGVQQPTLNAWFGNRHSPRDRVYIYRLCKCLEVPYSEGLARFGYEPAVLADTLAQHNISLHLIEEQLNISPNMMRSYIRRKSYPNGALCNRIADYLDIDRNDFFRDLNNERLGLVSNTEPVDTPEVPEITTSITAPAEVLNIQSTPEPAMDASSTIKWSFNTFYDLLPLYTITQILDLFAIDFTEDLLHAPDDIYWKHIWESVLDRIYDRHLLPRADYDKLVAVMRDKGLYE